MKLLLDTWQDEQNKEMRFAYQVGRFWNDFVFELDHMINCNFLNNFQRLQNGYLFTRWLHKRPKPRRRTARSAQSSSSGLSLSATDVELVPSQHSNRLQIELTMYYYIFTRINGTARGGWRLSPLPRVQSALRRGSIWRHFKFPSTGRQSSQKSIKAVWKALATASKRSKVPSNALLHTTWHDLQWKNALRTCLRDWNSSDSGNATHNRPDSIDWRQLVWKQNQA